MDISLLFFFLTLLCHGQYESSYRELGPNMNIHITWLTYVRTGPKKKIAGAKIGPGRPKIGSKNFLPKMVCVLYVLRTLQLGSTR